jgi:fermentation-respiration switch protein FrsA (DUF1100 family)
MRKAMNAQRNEDFKSGRYKYAPTLPMPEELTADSPRFLREYVDFYKTPRGFHKRSPGSTGGWAVTSGLSLLNTKLLAYANEIETPVLLVHGEKAHSRYFSEDAFKLLKGGNKELLIVPGANHTDLYDNLEKIPFDRIAGFYRKNLK